MKRQSFCRIWLLVVAVVVLLTLAPLELVAESNSYYQAITAPVIRLESNLFSNLARPNLDYPGEFMLAANSSPVANYFCFALKPLNLNGTKLQYYKVLGIILHWFLGSLVIMLFYFFYLNAGIDDVADPQTVRWFKMRRITAL